MLALETIYKGYRFRSRTEARWAVAFDVMGLSWEYEPEGYVTCDHFNEAAKEATRDYSVPGHYLPDFRIGDLYIEVKPQPVIDAIWAATADPYGWCYDASTIAYDAGDYREPVEPILKPLGLICHGGPTHRLLVLGTVGEWPLAVVFHEGDWMAVDPAERCFGTRWHEVDAGQRIACMLARPPWDAIKAARSARFGT